MKSKLHFDLNTYEFIEIEKEGEFAPEEIVKLHDKYHKLINRKQENKTDKIEKLKYDFVQELELPDEPIILSENE